MNTQTVHHPASERGHVKFDWLESFHSFSFGNYYHPAKMGFGALRVINDDIIAGETGFDTHGHKDMEIITIPLQGRVLHKDSLGTEGDIKINQVQMMAAGTGIRHSEHNPDAETLKLFQIWIVPRENGLKPSYQQMDYTLSQGKIKWLVSPTQTYKSDATLVINQDAFVGMAELGNESLKLETPMAGLGTYILNVSGSLSANGVELNQRDAYGHWDSHTEISGELGSKLLIFHVPTL
ncbi:MAG: hypothetical protein CME71_03525 [Halobacteriovorax sp.]|nr:hypothetical protein [Halobacteriovorax sp.]|tara:strand:- start:346 stop:1056 length:711 start_codon:yes stop_codon:yes gene_type:complete